MFKVSFKGGYKKVQISNDGTTLVTLIGEMKMSPSIGRYCPKEIWDWMLQHPLIDARQWVKYSKNFISFRIEVTGKSVCAKGDVFSALIGQRIAESRAKIKLFKFMYKLIDLLCNYYSKLLLGYKDFSPASFVQGSLYTARMKYRELWVKESHHLGKLLEEA